MPLDHTVFVADVHRQQGTYSLAQAQRLWSTAALIEKHASKDGFLVDLGAFPFALQLILREHLGFTGRMLGTANKPLRPEWIEELTARNIETAQLNLDPLVRAAEDDGLLPERLDLPDESVDVVVMAHVIEHLYHPLLALQEAARVLKPGGKMLLSTDNALRLDALMRMLWRNDFLYDPLEHTSAASFHFWRGHNRFFSANDLERLLALAGLATVETVFDEIFYHAFSADYFLHPVPMMARWRAQVLAKIPGYRNEVMLVAEKSSSATF